MNILENKGIEVINDSEEEDDIDIPSRYDEDDVEE